MWVKCATQLWYNCPLLRILWLNNDLYKYNHEPFSRSTAPTSNMVLWSVKVSALELPHCDVDSAAALVPWQQSSYDERMAQTIEKTVYLRVSFSTVLDSFIDTYNVM